MSDVADDISALWNEIYRLRSISTPYYAKSTYTPTYTGLTTAGVTTYTTQQGSYIRIGKLVIATATIIWTAATGTGNALFSLPFASANVSDQNYSGGARLESITFANSTPTIQLGFSQAFIRLNSPLTNAGSTNVAVEAAGNVVYTVAYFID